MIVNVGNGGLETDSAGMRIVFITCHFPPDSIGGGQVQSHRLCQALGLRHHVTVYTRDYTGRRPREERVGTYIVRRRRVLPIPVIRSMVDLIAGIRYVNAMRHETDVVISFHMQLAALMCVVARILYHVPCAVSPRGAEDFRFKGLLCPLQRFIYLHADAVLIQSHAIRDEFMGQAKRVFSEKQMSDLERRTCIFPNVLEPSTVVSPKPLLTVLEVIYVGRLVPIKGIEFLLSGLRDVGENVHLTIVGAGPDRQRLMHLSSGLPVEFLGEISMESVEGLLTRSHVLVLPSLSENLPNVVLEALRAGVPVIASRVGALPEVIDDGQNGYLVDPGNAAQIADRLRRLGGSGEEYTRMSNIARASVQRFSPESLLPQISRQLRLMVQRAHNT